MPYRLWHEPPLQSRADGFACLLAQLKDCLAVCLTGRPAGLTNPYCQLIGLKPATALLAQPRTFVHDLLNEVVNKLVFVLPVYHVIRYHRPFVASKHGTANCEDDFWIVSLVVSLQSMAVGSRVTVDATQPLTSTLNW